MTARQADKAPTSVTIVNKKARFNYDIIETYEAGLILLGSEVKSLRAGHATLSEGYVRFIDDAPWLIGANIAQYDKAHQQNHDPDRSRKLLIHRREIKRWLGKVKEKGLTIVPLKLYFNARGFAKLQIGLAKGRAVYDKRRQIKDRDQRRDLERQSRKYR